MMRGRISTQRWWRGFSLIELLVVISVIAIVAAFAVPAVTTMLRGSQMTQATQSLDAQISLARQLAISRSQAIEVRFYRYGDSEAPGEDVTNPASGKFRAMQMFEVFSNGTPVPLGKMEPLPGAIIFSYSGSPDGLSSIIEKPKLQQPGLKDPSLPRGIDTRYDFASFRFLADGSTNLSAVDNWFVTLINLNDILTAPNQPPANFYTLQIDPVNGNTRSFRPNVQ